MTGDKSPLKFVNLKQDDAYELGKKVTTAAAFFIRPVYEQGSTLELLLESQVLRQLKLPADAF